MTQPASTPQDAPASTPLRAAAVALHETFLSLQSAGFTEDQALRVIGVAVASGGKR